ncbi:MAG: hypothetical protein HC822_17600 [Oscillochloris sp.]|nr:hypothetical protein [Oscillochloris sp.]
MRFFQIWNEPNLKNEWNWQTPRPEDFVALLRVGAEAARAANPDAVILFPGLAPTDGLDPRAPLTELEYLDRVYKAGGGAYFDIMAAQSYGLGQPPDENRYIFLRNRANWNWRHPIDTRNDVSRVVLLREVMERNGDTQTPVWVTEFGWNAAPATIPPERRFTWGEPVSEETKGEYLVGQIERAQREWPWMGVMNVWMLRFGGYAEPDPADPTPYFALVGRDWQILPAYERLREYMNRPPLAGIGAHTWEHPAVEALPAGWRVRFYGSKITFLGGLDAEAAPVTATINGQTGGLEPVLYAGQRAWATAELPLAEHTIELRGNLPPDIFVVERSRPFPLFWDYGGLVLMLLLVGSSVITAQHLIPRLDALRQAWRIRATPAIRGAVVFTLMALALLVFYRLSSQLPPTIFGFVLFAGLALWRPDLALIFVPLTIPLYFMPKGIFDSRFGLRESGIYLPLHEVVLLITVAATAARWAWSTIQGNRLTSAIHNPPRPGASATQDGSIPQGKDIPKAQGESNPHSAFRILRPFWPVGLFLIAGIWGVIIADARGRPYVNCAGS